MTAVPEHGPEVRPDPIAAVDCGWGQEVPEPDPSLVYEERAEPWPDPVCEMDGHVYDTYDNERYWHCDRPGVIAVDGTLLCEDHAGERGCGPKQEEYGYDPGDGMNPAQEG